MMTDPSAAEITATENVRAALEAWREVQVSENPSDWQSGSVTDFIAICVSQRIDEDGEIATSTTYLTAHRQPKYRTLGLMVMGDEMIDAAYDE